MADHLPVRCAVPDWQWLRQADDKGDSEARYTRYRFLALLGYLSGHDQDLLLTGLTDGGERCFDEKSTHSGWLDQLCERWISEPQTISRAPKSNRSLLNSKAKFRGTKLELSTAELQQQGGNLAVEQEKWLTALAPADASDTAQKLREISAEFSRRGVRIHAARRWHRPGSNESLIELQISSPETESESPWPFAGPRLLLLVKLHSVTLVGVPRRFGFQHDEGEIVDVSDLDHDGNLEVWFRGKFGECRSRYAKPGIDCAIEISQMGEIRGDALSYFTRTPGM